MKKKIILLLSVVVICMSLTALFTFSTSAETSGYYTYTVSNGEATITDVDTSISGNVTIPAILGGYPVTSIASFAFYNCTGLTQVTIPNSVVSIGDYAFRGCTGLKAITLPESVESIGNYAFSGCTGLKAITIPNSVTSISSYAFYNCAGLTQVTIPKSVVSIGSGAFSGCTGVESVTVAEGNTVYHSENNCIIETGTNTLIAGFANSIIPSYVTIIGSSAFDNCTGLTQVTFAEGSQLESIGDYAFKGCTGLTSITIPESVTSIGSDAFYNCTNIQMATIPTTAISYIPKNNLKTVVINGGTSIGYEAFKDCTGLKAITIPNSVTSIGDWAFRYCTGLTQVTFAEGSKLESIGYEAFYNCTGLASITIPESVVSIGYQAFYGCTGLASITIPESVVSIGSYAFYNTAYYNDSQNWENGVLYIGKHLIEAQTGILGSYSIKEGTLCISSDAFYNCTGLTQVTIPNGVTSIGSSAFSRCTGLTQVTIPNSVTSIGYDAFYVCTGLTAVYIDDLAAWCAISFSGNSYANPLYYAKNLYLDGELVTDLVIPEGVTSIGSRAFYNCTRLEVITIPESVVSIDYEAFKGCTGLTQVTIPESVVSIGSRAFYNCTGLTSITIPESVTSIGYDAFRNCTGLKLVTVNSPDVTKELTSSSACGYLANYAQTVVFPTTITKIGSYVTSTFTYVDTVAQNGKLVKLYSMHYHVENAATWVATKTGAVCSECGVAKGCSHDMTPATCTAPAICTLCGHTEGNALGHNMQSATCETPSTCSRCDHTEGDALGHDAISHSAQEPTCTQIGWYAYETCSRCDYTTYVEKPALGHDAISHSAQEPTCLEIGWYAYETCSRCDYTTYAEKSALGHILNEATCTMPSICERCDHIAQDALGHDIQDATCTLPETCARCSYESGKALGHSVIHHDAKAPTCVEIGWDAYEACARCDDYTTYAEKPALGHAFGEWHVTKEPTAAKNGIESRVCANDPAHIETREIVLTGFLTKWTTDTLTASLYEDPKNAGKYILHVYGNGAMDNYTTTGMPWYSYLASITELIVYEGVTSIGDNAMRGSTSLVKVTLPTTLTEIGASAFRNCTALTEISAFESLETVGSYAFMGASSLPAVTIGKNATLTSVGSYAFSCEKLSLVVIESETVAASLVSQNAYGNLFASVTAVSVPKEITNVGSFIKESFESQTNLFSNGREYTVYSKHSHAGSADVWDEFEDYAICTVCGAKKEYIKGDINGDGSITILDISALVKIASGDETVAYYAPPDINGDGSVTILDISALVKIASGET